MQQLGRVEDPTVPQRSRSTAVDVVDHEDILKSVNLLASKGDDWI